MEAAQKPIHLDQAGRHAGQLAVALVGLLGHLDRAGERLAESEETALGAVGLGQREQLLLGDLDLAFARGLQLVLVGIVDHVLADRDELAAEVEVVDGTAVVLGVDDGDDRGGELDQVLGAADLGQPAVLVEHRLQSDRVGDLAALDQLADGGEDPAMDRVGEVVGAEEVADPLIGGIVDQEGAEKALLGLVVVRGGAVSGLRFLAHVRPRRRQRLQVGHARTCRRKSVIRSAPKPPKRARPA